MDASEMKKLAQSRQKIQEPQDEALSSILHVIQEAAGDGLEELITPPVFDLGEAQRLKRVLEEKGYDVTLNSFNNGSSLIVGWK